MFLFNYNFGEVRKVKHWYIIPQHLYNHDSPQKKTIEIMTSDIIQLLNDVVMEIDVLILLGA